jgi:energy-coupling factor transporter ATP-binding protein EcfA2
VYCPRLQTLLLHIWDETAATVLFVTHDVAEGVFLADRVYVVSPRPGTIVEEIPVPFARPREQGLKEQREFQELEAHVLARLRRAEGAAVSRAVDGGGVAEGAWSEIRGLSVLSPVVYNLWKGDRSCSEEHF